MNLLKSSIILFMIGMATSASAKLLQIIHTNDLHSYFEGSIDGRGGYSKIKTLVDQLRSDASSKNIKTLFLDAGDFGEGSTYYFSNRGVDSLRALDLLGVDVTVLGNHDFILGGNELSRQLQEAHFKANFLSANMYAKAVMGLNKKIKSHVDYDLDGMKIRIFGLTTPEIHYQYPLLPNGFIGPSHKKGMHLAEKANKDGVDFLIALTHIGIDKDTILASHSRTIDVVIGGHSHTRLEQPKMVENLNGELVPVFQTGAHGLAVGSMIIDVLGEGEYKLVDYRLYDIDQNLAEDTNMKSFVEEAYVNRERYFNRSWTEVIGFSEIQLTGTHEGKVKDPRSCWSRHIARLIRQTADADVSIQFDIFQGEQIPAGKIIFGHLVENLPHFRNWGDQGWSISRSKIRGFILKQVIKSLSSKTADFESTMDGLHVWDSQKNKLIPFVTGTHTLEQALINGKPIDNFKLYGLALPSEIPYAFGKMSKAITNNILLHSEIVPNSHFWPLIEEYLAKNSPLKCLEN